MQRTEQRAHQWGYRQALGVRICRGYRGAGTMALISYQLLTRAHWGEARVLWTVLPPEGPPLKVSLL